MREVLVREMKHRTEDYLEFARVLDLANRITAALVAADAEGHEVVVALGAMLGIQAANMEKRGMTIADALQDIEQTAIFTKALLEKGKL
jgi:hypothetical protein